MKCILYALLVAALPFGSVLAEAPKAKDVKVTLVYQHELPNVPGKSIKGVLVEYGPGGYSPAHTHPKSAFIYAIPAEVRLPWGYFLNIGQMLLFVKQSNEFLPNHFAVFFQSFHPLERFGVYD